ncbi:MAG: O-antigen ligase family protein [Dehalococcoidia bacterium]
MLAASDRIAFGRSAPGGALDLAPAAGRWLPLAGVIAAGAAGMLAGRFDALPAAMLLLAVASLLAALLSAHAAVALLIALLVIPLETTGLLAGRLNQVDTLYGAAVLGLALRAFASKERLALQPVGLALLAFIAAGTVALAAGVLSTDTLNAALGHFRGPFGYALIPALVLTMGKEGKSKRQALLWLLCAVAVITAARAVLAWAQLNGLVHLSGVLARLAAPGEDQRIGVVAATGGEFGYLRAWAGNFEGNSLGTFLVLIAPVSAYFALQSRSHALRLAFGAATALLLVALMASYSRGAYLGLAAASLPLIFNLWRRSPLGAIALVLTSGMLLVFLASELPGAQDRLITLGALGDDPTVQHRQIVYQQVLDAFRQNPIWGIGLGTRLGEFGTGGDSLYLFLLLHGGLLVSGAFLLLVWVAGRQVIDAFRAGRLSGLDLAVAAGLSGFAVHSAVDYTLWNPKVALTMWLMVGFLMAAVLEHGDERVEDPPVEEPQW